MQKVTLTALLIMFAGLRIGVAERANIVFMFCDDMRYDCIGANGNKIIHTPTIGRLADGGVSFDRAFVTTAILRDQPRQVELYGWDGLRQTVEVREQAAVKLTELPTGETLMFLALP